VSCSWCEERLPRFVDDELSPRERAGVLAHVDACRACRALFDELRVVDGLLLGSRRVDLAPGFTSATMAEIRSLPRPCAYRAPLFAYAVSYLLGAWLLAGAALILAPGRLREAIAIAAGTAQTTFDAFGGVGHATTRSLLHVAGFHP
jgi:anti-sigma factor RsiW